MGAFLSPDTRREDLTQVSTQTYSASQDLAGQAAFAPFSLGNLKSIGKKSTFAPVLNLAQSKTEVGYTLAPTVNVASGTGAVATPTPTAGAKWDLKTILIYGAIGFAAFFLIKRYG